MSVADQGKLYRQALKAAVADARLSAETLAAASGRSLGKVTSVVECGGATPVPMFEKAAASDAGTPDRGGSARDDRDCDCHLRARLGLLRLAGLEPAAGERIYDSSRQAC